MTKTSKVGRTAWEPKGGRGQPSEPWAALAPTKAALSLATCLKLNRLKISPPEHPTSLKRPQTPSNAMNYAQTSMCYINLLPPRIKQMVYDFDGRYKTAKDQCIELIRQRGMTPIGIKGSDQFRHVYHKIYKFNMKTFHRDFPEYYAEVQRRISMYRSRMENGHIRGVTTHLKRLPKTYCFNDALGSYKLGQVFNTVIIDGIAYKSSERMHSVALEAIAFKGVPTVVKCIDILDPNFKKTIKGRQSARVKVYRSLGVSENGIPASIFKKILRFRFGVHWLDQKCDPPASLAAVTEMLERSSKSKLNSFTIDGNDYTICVKTGTGIIYSDKNAVGYVTKKMKLRLVLKPPMPAPKFVYNPETDVEVDVDGKYYYMRNGMYIMSIDSCVLLGYVNNDEVIWFSDAR